MFAADCTSCSYAEICISRQCARVCRAYVIKLSPASEGKGMDGDWNWNAQVTVGATIVRFPVP